MQTMPAPQQLAAREIPIAVDESMASFLDRRGLPSNLDEAVRYALLGPGKRTRPQLTVLACQALGVAGTLALPGAGAVEMIHAFSLVHDDLPALDNDELRRGRPTTHVSYGEPMAILAGDALMSLAFELAGESPSPAPVTHELARACSDMIAGQVLDTLGGGSDEAWTHASNSDRLRRIHLGKTGALIRAACRIGALSAGIGEDTPEFESLSEFGLDIGLMFQIVDDLLDVEQQASHVGKATGKDRDAGKLTYPSILGVGDAKSEVRRLEADALDRLACLGPDADPLREFCRDLAIRTK